MLFLEEGKMSFQKKWVWILLLACFSACSLKLFPSKDPWYAKHYIIMQDFEWDAYKALSPAGKTQFQELFWKVRDPKAQAIFMDRLDYVTKTFKKENQSRPWGTDRAMIYLLNGNPAEVRYVQGEMGGIQVVSTRGEGGSIVGGQEVDKSREDIDARMSEIWVYPYKSYVINYQFNFVQPRSFRLSPNLSESQFREELELYSRQVTYRIMDVKKYLEQLEEMKEIK